MSGVCLAGSAVDLRLAAGGGSVGGAGRMQAEVSGDAVSRKRCRPCVESCAQLAAGHKKRAGAIAHAITPAQPKMAATYSPTFAVPSAQLGLTSLFGMGRGGTPTL